MRTYNMKHPITGEPIVITAEAFHLALQQLKEIARTYQAPA